MTSSISDHSYFVLFFFFNDTATTEIYTLSLHDALPISSQIRHRSAVGRHLLQTPPTRMQSGSALGGGGAPGDRSEEHTSELQSHSDLVCRLLLEKKKNNIQTIGPRMLNI